MKKSFEEKFMIFFLLLVILGVVISLLSGCISDFKDSESLKDQSRIDSSSQVRLQSSYDDYLMNTVIYKRGS